MDDQNIIALYWARSETAISETAQKYGGYCFSIAKNILTNHEDAEESVNDTYLTAWNAMPPRRPSILATFLGKITRRLAIDRWRYRNACKRGGGEVTLALDELEDCASQDSLEKAMDRKELAVAFNNMAASVQNSETIRQEFVANVSHELKTPMTTIAGYLDGILDGTIPPEKHRVYMELVSTEVRRLSRLVRNMLDVARLKDQGIPPDKLTDFDICEEASQALLSFEQRINQKHLNVDIDMPEFGLTVHAFADAVSQVIYNLLDNAAKSFDDGGTLSIHARQQGGKAVVSIANTGPTIDPAELPLIFDRFHKTDKSRSTDRDGVGLGLYIVKTIVLAHGEDIYVTSRDGKTEFTFTMPLVN